MSRLNMRGFTLVEILVVVILLGILAAIVIPQFSHATTDTRKAALSDQLQTLRVQIQLFTMQHGEVTPNLDGANWDDLLTRTLYNGRNCGPYLQDMPRNTLNEFSNVLVVADNVSWGDAVGGANIGFVYNPATGLIWGTNTAGNRVYNEANPLDPNN